MEVKNILSQLEANRQGLIWAKSYLKEQQLANTRSHLILNRVNLKRIKKAMGINPAAAVFGESQVGKSYMVDCLLTSETSVLNVYDGHEKPTGFLEYINPLGGGKEATGLITRFTVEKVWTNKEFPIRVEMLSPIDVVMVIVDTYFNDVENLSLPKNDDIIDEISRLKSVYEGSPQCQSVITEDEIFELSEYFKTNMLKRGESFRESLNSLGYFSTLAKLISKIPVSEWKYVFSFLWNNQDRLTTVFKMLMTCLESLDFSQTVYVKIDAVLREPGTILHVDRMYELFGISSFTDEKGNICTIVAAKVPTMEVMTSDGKVVSSIRKSEFCALAMEVAFTISDANSKDKILREKPFLRDLDVLDFPGARSRKMIDASDITETEACEMLLRGKVAYLFNKYSQQYLISNLLFCHHAEKSEVSTLPSLLKGWVESTVGSTPEEREEFMRNTEIPPLFLIGTKFNIDLTKTPDDSKGDESSRKDAMSYRWTKRFGNLMSLLGQNTANNWMTNWVSGQPFKNIFLLRSYEFSCQNGLYYGYEEKDVSTGFWQLVYDETGKLQGEQGVSPEYVPFFKGLKETFKENDFVKKHFADAEKSWSEAVDVKHDGSAWIIENLTRSSRNMKAVRELQFTRVMQSSFNSLVQTLFDFYHDDNADVELRKQLDVAGRLNLNFDVLFGRDKYFFSDFVSSIVIEEEQLHDVVLDTINAMKLIEETDFSALFAIRARAKIDPKLSYEENKSRLRSSYNCSSDEELEQRLKEYNVTIGDIINPPQVMNFSLLIADSVKKAWFDTQLNLSSFSDFVKRGLSPDLLEILFSNLKVLYNKVKLTERIAKRIHPYVTGSSALDDMSDMLADISAEMINRFVNTAGAIYYDSEMWNDIKTTVSHNGFDIEIEPADYYEVEFDDDATREDLPNVFKAFDNVDKVLNELPVDLTKLQNFSNYEEYRKWMNRIKISFLATQGIPKYNVDMNNALRKVLQDNIVDQEPLAEMVRKCCVLNSFIKAREIHEN